MKGEIKNKNQFHKRKKTIKIISIKIEIKNKNKEISIQQKTQKIIRRLRIKLENIVYEDEIKNK